MSESECSPIQTCDVYWGSHGCDKERGHRGAHWCDCCDCPSHRTPWGRDDGCVATWPYYGWATRFYGDDAPKRRIRPSLQDYWHRMTCNVPVEPRKLRYRRPWRPCWHDVGPEWARDVTDPEGAYQAYG